MQLFKVIDPRDNLEKAKRKELIEFAHAHGLTHLTTELPAILIRKELRSRGLVNIRIPARKLGSPPKRDVFAPEMNAPVNENDVTVVNAEDDLARQYGLSEPEKPPEKPKPKNGAVIHEIAALRKKAKAMGIKVDPRDTREMLKAKIRGKVST